MSNTGKSPLGTSAVIRNVKTGLVETVLVATELIHSKPILTFTIRRKGPDGEWRDIDCHFQIDPKKKRPEHANRIEAVQQRLNAATRMIEKFAAASGQLGEGKTYRVSREDLPDAEIITDLLAEQDAAMDVMLLDMVTKNYDGQTMWDYQDEQGNYPNLTSDFLRDNIEIAERMQLAFRGWNSFTKASSEAAMKAKMADGMKEATAATQNHSSSVLPTPSIVQSSNGTIAQGADLSLPITNQSS